MNGRGSMTRAGGETFGMRRGLGLRQRVNDCARGAALRACPRVSRRLNQRLQKKIEACWQAIRDFTFEMYAFHEHFDVTYCSDEDTACYCEGREVSIYKDVCIL
jgi:hypothetical protein